MIGRSEVIKFMKTKRNGFKIWILPIISIICAVTAALIVYGGSDASRVSRAINLGNKYLEDNDYEQAQAYFTEALNIEPSNLVAMEGIMQAAYETGDYDVFVETLTSYVDIVSGEEYLADGKEKMILQMQKNAECAFDNTKDYIQFLVLTSANLKLEDSGEHDEWMVACNLKMIDELVEKGDYEETLDILRKLIKDYGVEEYNPLLKELLCKSSEALWKQRKFGKSLDYLKEALNYADDPSTLKDSAYIVVRDYAFDCKNKQKYDEAKATIEWFEKTFGKGSFNSLLAEIDAMEKADANVQAVIEKLNSAFDAENINLIEEIMLGDEFTECAKQMHRVIFCNSLRATGDISGHGTAIYNNGGKAYVYYGDMSKGVRQGKGLWYYTAGEGNLTKCDLTWVNDVPNGPGTCEYWSEMTTRGVGGVVLAVNSMYVKEEVNLVNGIYNGVIKEHNEVRTGDKYSFDVDVEYKNGIPQKLEVGEYTSEIHPYLVELVPMVYVVETRRYDSYWGEYYTGHNWRTWSSEVVGISGVSGGSLPATVKNRKIALE